MKDKLNVFWIGCNPETKRVWGYFVDRNIQSDRFGSIKTLQLVWGKKDGNLFFRKINNTRNFQKRAKQMVVTYKHNKELIDHLATEYEKHILVLKLKNQYV